MGSKIRDDLDGVVHAYNEGADTVVLSAGDEVPDGYFVGDHLLAEADGAKSDGEGDGEGREGEPPRKGKGSGRDAWAAYAETVDVVVEDDWSREDIIAAVDAAAS